VTEYIVKRGEQQKSYTEEQLKELIASNRLRPTDLVWREGWDNWKPLSEFSPSLINSHHPSSSVLYNQAMQQRDKRQSVIGMIVLAIMVGSLYYLNHTPTNTSSSSNSSSSDADITTITPQTIFNVWAKANAGDAIYQSGYFVKQGHVGVAGSVNGERPAYLARVKYKETEGSIYEMYIFYWFDGSNEPWYAASPDIPDMQMELNHFH
jgi:tellurite resistance-related uncharacterized protein